MIRVILSVAILMLLISGQSIQEGSHLTTQFLKPEQISAGVTSSLQDQIDDMPNIAASINKLHMFHKTIDQSQHQEFLGERITQNDETMNLQQQEKQTLKSINWGNDTGGSIVVANDNLYYTTSYGVKMMKVNIKTNVITQGPVLSKQKQSQKGLMAVSKLKQVIVVFNQILTITDFNMNILQQDNSDYEYVQKIIFQQQDNFMILQGSYQTYVLIYNSTNRKYEHIYGFEAKFNYYQSIVRCYLSTKACSIMAIQYKNSQMMTWNLDLMKKGQELVSTWQYSTEYKLYQKLINNSRTALFFNETKSEIQFLSIQNYKFQSVKKVKTGLPPIVDQEPKYLIVDFSDDGSLLFYVKKQNAKKSIPSKMGIWNISSNSSVCTASFKNEPNQPFSIHNRKLGILYIAELRNQNDGPIIYSINASNCQIISKFQVQHSYYSYIQLYNLEPSNRLFLLKYDREYTEIDELDPVSLTVLKYYTDREQQQLLVIKRGQKQKFITKTRINRYLNQIKILDLNFEQQESIQIWCLSQALFYDSAYTYFIAVCDHETIYYDSETLKPFRNFFVSDLPYNYKSTFAQDLRLNTYTGKLYKNQDHLSNRTKINTDNVYPIRRKYQDVIYQDPTTLFSLQSQANTRDLYITKQKIDLKNSKIDSQSIITQKVGNLNHSVDSYLYAYVKSPCLSKNQNDVQFFTMHIFQYETQNFQIFGKNAQRLYSNKTTASSIKKVENGVQDIKSYVVGSAYYIDCERILYIQDKNDKSKINIVNLTQVIPSYKDEHDRQNNSKKIYAKEKENISLRSDATQQKIE